MPAQFSMAGQGGGRPWRDLGPLTTQSSVQRGTIGESSGAATLLLAFQLPRPATVFVRLLPLSPFTDRFIGAALQDASGHGIALADDSRAVFVNALNTPADEARRRLPAGDYRVVISTSQWQEAPFALQLDSFALESPRLVAAGQGRLRGRLSTARPEVFLRARGGLRASLQPVDSLLWRGTGAAGLRAGLQVLPSYEQPPPAGLGHVWFIRQTGPSGRLRLGGASGVNWVTLELSDTLPGYIASELALPDFRFNAGRRTIFSDRAYDIYGAYPELGVAPSVLRAQSSPDTPRVPYLDLTNGRHRREVLVALPLDASRCLVLHLEETLAWNNDVVLDVDDALPVSPRLIVSNRRRSWFHRRRVSTFVTDGLALRRLQNPPSALLLQLDTVLPPLDQQLVERAVRVPGPSFRLPPLRILFPVFVAEARPPAAADVVFGADPSERAAGLLLSYGMTRLLAADTLMSSMAIYRTLEDFSAITAKADYDPKATGFVIANIPDRPDGLPILSPWLRDGGYRVTGTATGSYQAPGDQLLRYGRWNGPLPARTDTEVSAADPRWSLAVQGLALSADRLFRTEAPSVLLSYDWGNGAYCRLKLQGLGFSDEDLSVAPPERPQSGTLNGGRPRPLAGRGGLALGELTAQQTRRLRVVQHGRGRLMGDLAWGPRGRLKARGQMRATLTVAPDLTIVRRLLRGFLAGAGGLDRGRLNRPPTRLTGRGSLGRPWLSAKPPNEFPLVRATGRGRLIATLSAT